MFVTALFHLLFSKNITKYKFLSFLSNALSIVDLDLDLDLDLV